MAPKSRLAVWWHQARIGFACDLCLTPCYPQRYQRRDREPTSLRAAAAGSGCAAVLFAQLSTSLSLRWPQMPYVAHMPGAWSRVRQASGAC